MRRLDSYLVFFGPSELSIASDLRSDKERLGSPSSFSSWHKACDFVRERLESGEVAGDMDGFVVDPKTKRVVIRFSVQPDAEDSVNASEDPDSWKATAGFALDDGRSVVELSNVRDFAWELLEGARRDVPFRLTYLERNAERKAWCKALLMEVQKYRDMFGRTSF